MKYSLTLIFLFVLITIDAPAQCDNGKLTETCISSLDTNYHFLKNYPLETVDESKMMLEYSYVLTRDTEYIINICTANGANDIAVSVLDKNRKAVAETTVDGENLGMLDFKCRVTGIYYLQFTFTEGGNNCGSAILSFKSL